MRVLGVDPGLARTGVAVVEGSPGHLVLMYASCIETVPQTNEAGRLATLFDLVVEACTSLRPDVAAVEELFFSTNRRTAMRVSEARGVVLCALARQGVAIAEYTPTQVKEAVCGYGAARTSAARALLTARSSGDSFGCTARPVSAPRLPRW